MFFSEIKYGPRLHVYLCHVSSQDDAHPADALSTQDRHSCGWVSRKHASYPQEMGIRFDGIASVDTLRILSNESKISACIDVYVAEPTAREEQEGVCGPYRTAPFKRLGHVRFSNNAASDYQARELKTVGLHRRCSYIKLVLRNPHVNSYNMFQQVGIVALSVHGKLVRKIQDWSDTPLAIHIGHRVDVPLDEMMPPLSVDGAPTSPLRVPGSLAARFDALAARKRTAVAEEDFDTAEALKQRLIAIEKGEREIARLEAEKQRAVAEEDYAQAKELKLRIEAVRAANVAIAGAPPTTAAPSVLASTAPWSSAPPPPLTPPSPPSPPHRTPAAANVVSASRNGRGGSAAASPIAVHRGSNAHDEVVVRGKGYYDLSDATGGLTGNQADDRNSVNADELPLAGDGADWELALNTAIRRVSTVLAGPTPLSNDATAAAKAFVKDLGVYCVACLFSGKGQLREAGLRGAMSSDGSAALTSHSDAAWAQLVVYMSVKGYGVGDPVAGTAIAACSALSKVVQGKVSGVSVHQVTESVSKTLPELTARLGESNVRVQESVEKTVVSVARSAFGHRRVVELLLVDPDKVNKKPASVRAHVSRIHILSTLVDDFGLACDAPDGLDTRSLCTMVLLPSLQHSNAEVREAAVKLLAKLLCLDPGSTTRYVEDIKQAQQALLEEQVELYRESQRAAHNIARKGSDLQSDTVSVHRHGSVSASTPPAPPPRSPPPPPPPPPRAADVVRDADKPKARVASAAPLQRAPASIGEMENRRLRTCQFCGEYNPSFNEHNLDLHYVSACPMLCPCPLCDQVTEICQLQQHLVSECDKRRLVRECPRCHEAVRATEFNEHVAARRCIEAVPTHSVCPLCHARFKSGIDGWRSHLASSPGCPNNPRLYDGSALTL
ncbi:hypothetical protein NESM_000584300 [Novymonas esmeraldas]|uniref:TOG domain-containing protein n=1 Tax=Novymonas esmeraldas TaxID=1808958 RepID=A0AAW0EQJ0_9TRYP